MSWLPLLAAFGVAVAEWRLPSLGPLLATMLCGVALTWVLCRWRLPMVEKVTRATQTAEGTDTMYEVVFVSRAGERYHTIRNCSGLRTALAQVRGVTPCRICARPQDF